MCVVQCVDVMTDLLGVVESILYARRMPDALFNLAYYRSNNQWPPNSKIVVGETVRRNAAWKKDQDMQVGLCCVLVVLIVLMCMCVYV